MKMKDKIMYVAMGIGGTLLYQQLMNGNVTRAMRDMKKSVKKMTMCACDDLEDMM